MEYLYFAQLTNNHTFVERISKIRKFMKLKIQNQYYGTGIGYMDMVDVQRGDWFYTSDGTSGQALTVSLFGNGKDYYQGLLKSYIQSNGQDLEAIEMFKVGIDKLLDDIT